MNETHDLRLRSWVESANDPRCDFPIQNLPFGVFTRDGESAPSIGVAIGSQILALRAASLSGLISEPASLACRETTLNPMMSLPPETLSRLRSEISRLLAAPSPRREDLLVPMTRARMLVPAEIGDYTDFYASIHHATNVGSMFRPDNPLLPNYKHVPIGYHGRASSIIVSGSPVRRPNGQTKPGDAPTPLFGPSKMLDYESELGFFIGRGNRLGEAIPINEAGAHVFGFCLVNDWSARDIQSWEYQPLGPFLAKNFATTISPWVVTSEAIEPYRVAAFRRPDGDPPPLPHLNADADQAAGGINAMLEVFLASSRMRDDGVPPVRVSRASFSSMYWTVAQMVAHHAGNGCNLRTGDLLASGTVSNETEDSRGCLLELAWRGTSPVILPTGEERRFLQDGDQVIMKGYLEAPGRARIGFGECRGTILPAEPV